VAHVHQQSHFLGGEADEVIVAVMGDLQGG